MILRYIFSEIKRMLWRPFSLVLGALIVIIGLAGIIQPNGHPNRLFAFWSVQRPFMLNLLIPIIAGIVSAGSFAWDQRTGYTQLIMMRGFSRRTYLLSKAVAVAVSAGLVTLLGYISFYCIGVFFLPWGVSNPGSLFYETINDYPGPVPSLFFSNPILNDLLGIAIASLATGTLALLGMLTGIFIKNEYVAPVTPFGFFLTGGLLLNGTLGVLNPFTYVDIWGQYKYKVQLEALPYAGFLYWFILGTVVIEVSLVFFEQKELSK